jgi:hypothetical protein
MTFPNELTDIDWQSSEVASFFAMTPLNNVFNIENEILGIYAYSLKNSTAKLFRFLMASPIFQLSRLRFST